jgi:hypothetical protein
METIRQREAAFRAREAADDFTINLVPPPYGKGKRFDVAVADAGLTVHTTEYFSVNGDVPGLKVGREFNQAAFDLDTEGSEQDFSDAILGEDAAYVLSLSGKRDARVPGFEDVKDDAVAFARQTLKGEAYARRTVEIRESLRTGIDAGKTFRETAKSLALNVSTTGQFSAYEAMADRLGERQEIVAASMNLENGELSEVTPGVTNALVLYVASREPGDPLSTQFLKPQLLSTIDRYRAGLVFESWMAWALAQAGFMDNQPLTETEEEDIAD